MQLPVSPRPTGAGNRWVTALGLVLLLALVLAPSPHPETFVTTDEATQVARFRVQYSTGPVEGDVRPVEGTLTFDPAMQDSGLSGTFTVDMRSIDTGIGLRDRYLKNDYLETTRFQEATFTMQRAVPTTWQASDDGVIEATLDGALTLHGVTRTETVQATLTPTEQGYNVLVRFDILLTDYDIEPPIWLFLRVDNAVHVSVLLTLAQTG